MKLSREDYIKILDYYGIKHQGASLTTIKGKAERILADKLCRCIKRVDKTRSKSKTSKSKSNESRAIAICRDSVLRRKGLTNAGKFSCKPKARFLKSKTNRLTLKHI
tara:strand:+ start:494 stop:814 length:321 start_codon:yes stop_codon:yes gene_type:complete